MKRSQRGCACAQVLRQFFAGWCVVVFSFSSLASAKDHDVYGVIVPLCTPGMVCTTGFFPEQNAGGINYGASALFSMGVPVGTPSNVTISYLPKLNGDNEKEEGRLFINNGSTPFGTFPALRIGNNGYTFLAFQVRERVGVPPLGFKPEGDFHLAYWHRPNVNPDPLSPENFDCMYDPTNTSLPGWCFAENIAGVPPWEFDTTGQIGSFTLESVVPLNGGFLLPLEGYIDPATGFFIPNPVPEPASGLTLIGLMVIAMAGRARAR